MAAVTVTADNDRVDDAEAGTGYSNIGGGAAGAAEPSFAYQGTNLFNRKVTSTTGAGFYYDPTADGGSARDMTATNRTTMIVKIMVSDYKGLDATDGVLVRIGSGTADYYAFILAGTDSPAAAFQSYRPVGGLLIIAVDPNENTAYNDTGKAAGSPALSAVDYFGAVFAFTASTAKNENCGLDAIDIGSGLYLVGGDGADADGVWQDFVDADEGNTANRWGYARNGDGGSILLLGNMRIGTDDDATSTATVFQSVGDVVLWLDHLAAAGFSVLTLDLGNASTDILDDALHIGVGDSSNVDSRPDIVVTGTSGVAELRGTYENFRNVVLTSAVTLTGDLECVDLAMAAATLLGCTIRPNTASGVAMCNDFTVADASEVRFIQSGVGHAIEITSPGTYNFDALFFDGFGGTPGTNSTPSSGANDAAIYNSSGGAVTINVTNGGDVPSVRNAASSTTTVNNSRTYTITGIQDQNARVTIVDVVGDTKLVDNELVGVDGSVSYAYNYTADVSIDVLIRSLAYENREFSDTLTNANVSRSVPLDDDRVYANP